jgi:hypothetical protein
MKTFPWPPFEEITTFVVAIVVLAGSFYGLLSDGTGYPGVIYGGLISAVATFYFQTHATRVATRNTIDAQNNGLDAIRQTVSRIEDGRPPTPDDLAKRNH